MIINGELNDLLEEYVAGGGSYLDLLGDIRIIMLERMYVNLHKFIDSDNKQPLPDKTSIVKDIIEHLAVNGLIHLCFEDETELWIEYTSSTTDDRGNVIGEIEIEHVDRNGNCVNQYQYNYSEEDRDKGILNAVDHFIEYGNMIEKVVSEVH